MEFVEEYNLIGLFVLCFLSSTLIPFSSESVFLLLLINNFDTPLNLILVAGIGNSLGSFLTYWMGYYANRFFLKNKEGKMNNIQKIIKKYGSFVALISWVPFVGDVLVLGMGFFKTSILNSHLLLLFSKTARYYLLYLFL